MANGTEPIADDEFLYRRVPKSQFNAETGRPLDVAFQPSRIRDTTGLSLARGKYKTVAQAAASSQPGKEYYVAVLLARDVRQAGMAIEPRPNTPDGYDAAHCELSDLRADNYKDSLTLERQRALVDLCQRVEGPFVTPAAPSQPEA